MLTTRSCTWPCDPVPTQCSSHCRCASKTSLAGCWRMVCFSTQPGSMQFFLGHPYSGSIKVPTASGIDMAVSVMPLKWSKAASTTYGAALRHIRQLLGAHIRLHKSGWKRYCVFCVIMAGLRQHTSVWQICSQHPPSAGCAELTGQSNLSSVAVIQCSRISLAAPCSLPTHRLQSTNWQSSLVTWKTRTASTPAYLSHSIHACNAEICR